MVRNNIVTRVNFGPGNVADNKCRIKAIYFVIFEGCVRLMNMM